jgi:hypothetical protein
LVLLVAELPPYKNTICNPKAHAASTIAVFSFYSIHGHKKLTVRSNFGVIHNYKGVKAYTTRSSEDIAEGKPEKIDLTRSRTKILQISIASLL